VRPDGEVDPGRELDLTRVPVTTARAEERSALDVEPLRGPVTSVRPDGVVLTAPGQRLWQVGFDREPGDLAIEFDDRFTSPRAGSQLGVWLDDRQVFATAADWSGATGHHAVIDVSSLSSGQHTLSAVLTSPAREPAARVVLGGFVMRSRRVAATPDPSLSTHAKLALLVLLLFLVVGLVTWWLRHRRGERTSVARDDPAADH
jgi:hypothetical protein